MVSRLRQVLFLLIVVVLSSCNRNRLKVDISDIKNTVKIVRFDQEMFLPARNDTMQQIVELRDKYSDFFDLFTYKVIRIGGMDDEGFAGLFSAFKTDTMILNAKKMVDQEFADFESTAKEIETAFKYFQYHFPEKSLPVIYTCVSGYNQSVFTAENIIGISLDKYLGRDYAYYQSLITAPAYKITNMHKKKIVSDMAYAWAVTEFGENNQATHLLGNMIHQGKMMYLTDAMLPGMHDSLKIGYTARQLEWCKRNEDQMWLTLIDRNLLYSTNRMDILRYINDGPFTNGFPVDSPARTGIWIGWQIVRLYMDKHPEISLPQLMKNNDYQGILNASGYFPD